MDQRYLGILAALVSAASWAAGAILFKRLGDKLSPATLTLAKGFVATVLLGLAVLYFPLTSMTLTNFMLLVLSGLLGIAVGDTLFFRALENLGAHAIVVLLTLGQVFTLLLAVIWLGENPSIIDWIGIALIVAGVTMVLYSQILEGGQSRVAGIAFGIAAVICMSVATVIAKEALAATNSVQAAFVRMCAGTVGMLVYFLTSRTNILSLQPLSHLRFASFFLFSVMVVTFGGFWLSLYATKVLDVTIANSLGSTEPLFAMPLAAFFLNERIKPVAILGSFLAVFGIVFLIRPWVG